VVESKGRSSFASAKERGRGSAASDPGLPGERDERPIPARRTFFFVLVINKYYLMDF